MRNFNSNNLIFMVVANWNIKRPVTFNQPSTGRAFTLPGSAPMTLPLSAGSKALKTEIWHGDNTTVPRSRWLRWHDYVHRATSGIKSITNIPIPGTRKQEWPRKTWSECVKTDVSNCGQAGVDPQDRETRRAVFDIAWCCQPHRMGQEQHINMKMEMDG